MPAADSTRLLADRYRLEEVLGKGAAGTVHRAWDRLLDRFVAVKILAPRTDNEDRDRLLREARAAAALHHPQIVAIHDAGEDGDTPYLVMELVSGPNLRQQPPTEREGIIRVTREILSALEHAHSRGLIHRDLKPENILLEPVADGMTARLADFSVARLTANRSATGEGSIVGTPHYLAPEQALGEEIDGRADLYSLGAVLYELVTGRPPFPGSDALMVIAEHIHAPVVPPRTWRADLSPSLEEFILRLLAKRPEDRYPSAAAARAALDHLSEKPDEAVAVPDGSSSTLLAQLARGRLVARRSELNRLRELWSESLAGRGQIVLLSGEPGVGKTRLAQEVLAQARLSGTRVLRGGSYEFEAATPYLPFVEALRGFIESADDTTLREAAGDVAPDLARLAPELLARLGPFPDRPALTPAEERLRLFDAVVRLFRRLSAKGLILFIDDLHWADQGTLSLIQWLLRQIAHDRIMILGAYREVELDRTHPLAGALVEWHRERLVTRIALDRLSPEDTGLFLATLLGRESVHPEFARAIYQETEGNPFFLEEVVKSLIEQGQIFRRGIEWMSDTAENLIIPQSVKEAIGRRLDRLTPACLETLHLASAIGKTFHFPELSASTDASEDTLLDALDEGTRAQLIRSDGAESFAFTHDKIREVLYGEANPVRRRRLHARIVAGLEKAWARSLDAHATDLAHHAVLAGDLERGFRWSMTALDQAELVYAHEEARRYAEQARECAESLGDRAKMVDALEARSKIESRSGAASAAAEALERALPFVDDPDRQIDLRITIGQNRASYGDPRGLPYVTEALALVDRARDPDRAAQALSTIARYHHYRLEHRRAVELLKEALLLAEPAGNPETISLILGFLAGAYQHMAEYAESMSWAGRLLEYGRTEGDSTLEGMGHEFLSENLVSTGRWRESLVHSRRNREIGLAAGARDRLCWADFAELYALRESGDLAGAIRVGTRGVDLAETIGERRVAALIGSYLVKTLVDAGEDHEWPVMLARTRRHLEVVGQPFLTTLVGLAAVHAANATGDAVEAERIMESLSGVEMRDNGMLPIERDVIHAQLKLSVGDLAAAEALARELLARTQKAGSLWRGGMGHRILAECLLRRGDLDGAAAEIEEAIALHERLEHRLELARALRTRAAIGEARRAALDSNGGSPGGTSADQDLLGSAIAKDRDESIRLFHECDAREAHGG